MELPEGSRQLQRGQCSGPSVVREWSGLNVFQKHSSLAIEQVRHAHVPTPLSFGRNWELEWG